MTDNYPSLMADIDKSIDGKPKCKKGVDAVSKAGFI